MSYIIGSFNIRKCSEYAVEQGRRDFDLIRNIILSENIDIIGLQEIFSEYPLKTLKNRLGASWEYYFECPSASSEGYAFLWNTKRISLLPKGVFSHVPYIDNRWSLKRPPLIGRFIPVGSNTPFVELRIINTHIHHGGSDSCANLILRQKEYKKLAVEIYTKIAQNRDGVFRPAYTFICGDYNLKNEHCQSVLLTTNAELKMFNTQELPTTLKKSTEEKSVENKDSEGYTLNDYDHFTCSEREHQYCYNIMRVDAPMKYCNGDFNKYNQDVSDHVPVRLDFDLRLSNK